MGFFDTVKNVAGAVADKAAEMKEKAKKRQQEVMVHKSDSELQTIASEGGINGMAAKMELKDRGY